MASFGYDRVAFRIGIAAMLLMLMSLAFGSCRTIREVPVQTIEKVIVKDSIVRIHDTLTVTLPVEKIVEVIPEIDTSVVETSVAVAIAWLNKEERSIHHEIENKESLKTRIDTCYVTQTVDRIVEKEVPVEVEVIKHRYDALFWVSIGLNILILGLGALKLWLRK